MKPEVRGARVKANLRQLHDLEVALGPRLGLESEGDGAPLETAAGRHLSADVAIATVQDLGLRKAARDFLVGEARIGESDRLERSFACVERERSAKSAVRASRTKLTAAHASEMLLGNGRELEVVARDDELKAAERLVVLAHKLADEVELGEEDGVDHGDLVDDEHLGLEPVGALLLAAAAREESEGGSSARERAESD